MSYSIALKPIPKMTDVQLSMVLKKILSRIPVDSGATFMMRGQCIEVTTMKALRAEVGVPADRRLWPLVSASFVSDSLESALRKLAKLSEVTIVLDARATKSAKVAITAEFTNAPVDSAVRLLADMTDLRSVVVDNMLYVTTKENADRLQAEQEKRPAVEPPVVSPSNVPSGGKQ